MLKVYDSQIHCLDTELLTQSFASNSRITPRADKRNYKYLSYWKRALLKIKVILILNRFSGDRKIDPFIATETMLFEFMKDFRSFPNFLTNNWVLVPYSSINLLWIILITLSLIFITLFGIFCSAFLEGSFECHQVEIEAVIDIVFILDIILSFNLAKYDECNHLVTNRKEIFLIYLKERLFIDLFAALPFSLCVLMRPEFSRNQLMMFRHIPKMGKWVGHRRKMKNFSFLKHVDYFIIAYKNIWNVILVISTALLAIHIFSYLFFQSAKLELPNLSWVFNSGVQDLDFFSQYISTMYFSLTTLTSTGYGDLHPYTNIEKLLSMVWMFYGVIFLSISVSKFTVYMRRFIAQYERIEFNLLVAEDFSEFVKLPIALRKSLKKTIFKQNIIIHKLDIHKILYSIDLDLRYWIAVNIFHKAISKVPFIYDKTDEFIANFTFKLEYIEYKKDQFLWNKNAYSDGIYFIISGNVKFLYQNRVFYVYHENDFIGDIEIFLKTQRKFDAKVTETCICFKMNRESLDFLKNEYYKYYKELKKLSRAKSEKLIYGLSEMIAIFNYRKGLIFQVNKQETEKIQKKITEEIFAKDFFFNEIRRLEKAVYNLREIENYRKSIEDLIRELEDEYL